MWRPLAPFLILTFPLLGQAGSPECDGPDSWAARMAYVHLKNSGLTDDGALDFSRTRVFLLSSEEIGPDRYRQIHRVIFTNKTGQALQVLTSNEASSQECSMSGVHVFVISTQLGP